MLLSLASSLLALGSASAPPGAGPGVHTALEVEPAVDRALQHAPELRAARLGEEAARARADQARAAYWPRVSAGVSYLARWPKNDLPIDLSKLPFPPGVMVPEIGDVDDVHHLQAGLEVGLLLFDHSRGSRVESLEELAEAERTRTEESAAQLAFQVRAAFVAALFARDVLQIAESSLALAREEEARALLRREVGTGTDVSLAQARVRRAGLEAQVRRAGNDLARWSDQLASLIGSDTVPELRGDLEVLSSTITLGEAELARAPAIARLAAVRRSLLAAAEAKSAGFIPTMGVMAKAEVQYPRAFELQLGPVLSAGVNASWSIFDGFQRQRGVAEAEAQASQAEESMRAAAEQLRRRLIELDARRRTASADLRSAREAVAQSEVYVRAARAAVESGTGTELELNTAKNGLDQARIAVSQALLQASLVEAERLAVYGIAKREVVR